jgi:hypothetical protein
MRGGGNGTRLGPDGHRAGSYYAIFAYQYRPPWTISQQLRTVNLPVQKLRGVQILASV